jgi:hypothetical protein
LPTACDASGVSFRWKDYRANGRERDKVMRLSVGEFIRRFLLHVLPDGFHRIRHYGLFGNGTRQEILARARALLAVSETSPTNVTASTPSPEPVRCPCCGGRMIIIERFARGCSPHHPPTPSSIRIDTS